MNRDSKNILHLYSQVNLIEEQSQEEDGNEAWWQTAAKIIDPTGVLSHDDLRRALESYEQDDNAINFILVLVGIFNVIPNIGILAGGVGGVGWLAVKAALKSAAKTATKNPASMVSAGEKFLSWASKTPGVPRAFEMTINKAYEKGLITNKKTVTNLIDTVRNGKLPITMLPNPKTGNMTSKARQAAQSSLNAIKGAGSSKVAPDILYGGKVAKLQGLSRTGATFAPGMGAGSEYPSFMPSRVFPRGQGEMAGFSKDNPVEVKFDSLSDIEGKDKGKYIGNVGYNPKTQKFYKITE
jgi:hypothetical protein